MYRRLTLPQAYLATLLAALTYASPLVKRAEDVVQGALGTDGYWNDYDCWSRRKSTGINADRNEQAGQTTTPNMKAMVR